ncbi:hypothetical protein SK128_012547 [Halocaridina rubra]|uniref:Uncharacterized protein n=1 Tax=Halocaridina rubra TaxID=373956 RepID=A0AAN8WRR1_HALRR
MSEWEEFVGADFAEHGIHKRGVGITRAVSVLGYEHLGKDYSDIVPQGDNPRHQRVLEAMQGMASRRASTISKAVAQVTETKRRTSRFKILGLIVRSLLASQRNKSNENSLGNRVHVTPIEEGNFTAWK